MDRYELLLPPWDPLLLRLRLRCTTINLSSASYITLFIVGALVATYIHTVIYDAP